MSKRAEREFFTTGLVPSPWMSSVVLVRDETGFLKSLRLVRFDIGSIVTRTSGNCLFGPGFTCELRRVIVSSNFDGLNGLVHCNFFTQKIDLSEAVG